MSDDQAKPEQERTSDGKRKKQMRNAGVAAGVGSAAIVAALLYARSARRNPD
jgi:hypothetical protein